MVITGDPTHEASPMWHIADVSADHHCNPTDGLQRHSVVIKAVTDPGALHAAVFGIPDPDWAEQAQAVLEPAVGLALDDVDTAVIGAFAVERLAKYKLPASDDVIEQLPREAHGKLKKPKLRDSYWENASG